MAGADPVALLDARLAGRRLTAEDALGLATLAPLAELGAAARELRYRIRPRRDVGYIVNTNINYTNVCITRCTFCSFQRWPGAEGGYVLGADEVLARIERARKLGATQVLLQGGHHPRLGLAYFEALLSAIRDRAPSIHVHALSAPEVAHLSRTTGLDPTHLLERLAAAGLSTMPGGGAEVLSDGVRRRISPTKCSADEWIAIHRAAHGLGIRSSATMMFGTAEDDWSARVEHLIRLRALQDETGGFTAFIAWAYQPPDAAAASAAGILDPVAPGNRSTQEYLRVVALARLVLDNVATIQASPLTQAPGVVQLALDGGADDLGNVLLEEHVVGAAGVRPWLDEVGAIRLITEAGYTARRRDTYYRDDPLR